MLSWAVGFFILALVAAFFGFGGIASSAAGIAKVLLVLFVIGFIVSLILGMRGRGGVSRRDLFLAEQRIDLASAKADVLQRVIAKGVQLASPAGCGPQFSEPGEHRRTMRAPCCALKRSMRRHLMRRRNA